MRRRRGVARHRRDQERRTGVAGVVLYVPTDGEATQSAQVPPSAQDSGAMGPSHLPTSGLQKRTRPREVLCGIPTTTQLCRHRIHRCSSRGITEKGPRRLERQVSLYAT